MYILLFRIGCRFVCTIRPAYNYIVAQTSPSYVARPDAASRWRGLKVLRTRRASASPRLLRAVQDCL